LVWPHDVESFQGSTFWLFFMVQPWNIGVCWIDQVFVTELTAVIFFVPSGRTTRISTLVVNFYHVYKDIKWYYGFSLLHIFSLVLQPWMSAYIFMVQPWNIGVCWIDQVFVTELTAVIFFVHAAVLSIKTAFN
jgi:hypothetical protein